MKPYTIYIRGRHGFRFVLPRLRGLRYGMGEACLGCSSCFELERAGGEGRPDNPREPSLPRLELTTTKAACALMAR